MPMLAGLFALGGGMLSFLGGLFGGRQRKKAAKLQKQAMVAQTQSAINTLTFNIGQREKDIGRIGEVMGEQENILRDTQGRESAIQQTGMRAAGAALNVGSPLEVALQTAIAQEQDVATLQREKSWQIQSAQEEINYLEREKGLQEDLLAKIAPKGFGAILREKRANRSARSTAPAKIGWQSSGGL